MLRRLALLGILATGLAIAQEPGGALTREAREAFLRTARVVSMKDIGEGATHPMKVVLEDGTRRMKAIFKTVDLRLKLPYRFGGQTAPEIADSYRHEVAAYELDKLLNLNMLPVTVAREIEGKKGSLREWVEEVMPHYGHGSPPPDMAPERDRMHAVWLFDYLIYNVDRRTHNLMMAPGWTPILIDHSMAFTHFDKPFRPMYRFPREFVEGLRRMDRRTLDQAVGRYLRPAQVDAVMRRREVILKAVDREVADHGEAEVLFPLPVTVLR